MSRYIDVEDTMSKAKYDPAEAYEAQEKFCEENSLPLLAPSIICPKCYIGIYSDDGGISVEKAGRTHITYCPFCHASFGD